MSRVDSHVQGLRVFEEEGEVRVAFERGMQEGGEEKRHGGGECVCLVEGFDWKRWWWVVDRRVRDRVGIDAAVDGVVSSTRSWGLTARDGGGGRERCEKMMASVSAKVSVTVFRGDGVCILDSLSGRLWCGS